MHTRAMLSRNEHCPCGSMKKYKRCCGLKASKTLMNFGCGSLKTLVDAGKNEHRRW